MKKLLNVGIVIMLMMIVSMNTPVNAQLSVRSVGMNIGTYTPSMDYWNDNALSTWSNKFGGGLYGNINIELHIVKVLGARVGVGYWTQELSESGIEFGDELRTDKITVQFLPVNFDVIIRSPEEMSEKIGVYGGLGTAVNFISMEYSISIPSVGDNVQDHSGRNFLVHLIFGIDYKVLENFAVGAEFKYVFSKYSQQVHGAGTILEEDVSINGAQLMGTLKYLF